MHGEKWCTAKQQAAQSDKMDPHFRARFVQLAETTHNPLTANMSTRSNCRLFSLDENIKFTVIQFSSAKLPWTVDTRLFSIEVSREFHAHLIVCHVSILDDMT